MSWRQSTAAILHPEHFTCRVTEANNTQEQLTIIISTFSTHKTGNECRKKLRTFASTCHWGCLESTIMCLSVRLKFKDKLYQKDKQNPNNSQQQPSCYTLHSNLLHSLHAPWIWYKQRPQKKLHYEIKAGIRPRKQCGLLGLPRVCGRCPSCTMATLSFHGSATVWHPSLGIKWLHLWFSLSTAMAMSWCVICNLVSSYLISGFLLSAGVTCSVLAPLLASAEEPVTQIWN